jgi:hypothetical protein
MNIKNYQSWDIKNEKVRATDAVYERVFGAGRREATDWREHLPEFENQYKSAFCLTFSYMNILETIMKSKNKVANFSDRWTGVHAKTNHIGTTFNRVMDAAREHGILAEKDCPVKEEWLKNPRRYWREINDLSKVSPNAPRAKGINHSWVGTSIRSLKNALADTPLWIGIGVGNTWENEIVRMPRRYGAYHGVMLAYIDNKYKYIFDSLGRPLKKLALNYKVLYAKSPKDLPEGWAEANVTTVVDKIKLNQISNEMLCRDYKKGELPYLGHTESFVRSEYGKSKERQWVIKIIEYSRMLGIVRPDELLGKIKK